MSQDDIDATKAPLMDHLIELRAQIDCDSLYAFLAAFLVCFFFSRHIYNILHLSLRARGRGGQGDADCHPISSSSSTPTSRLSMFRGGGHRCFPVIAVQIYKFIAPGLYRNERAGVSALS